MHFSNFKMSSPESSALVTVASFFVLSIGTVFEEVALLRPHEAGTAWTAEPGTASLKIYEPGNQQIVISWALDLSCDNCLYFRVTIVYIFVWQLFIFSCNIESDRRAWKSLNISRLWFTSNNWNNDESIRGFSERRNLSLIHKMQTCQDLSTVTVVFSCDNSISLRAIFVYLFVWQNNIFSTCLSGSVEQ